ncbi:acyl-CoA dehydrogenase family protein [Roseibium sp. HPY-6]|uniref:acyl-CoA dehydrogenase family protein n=1 Tax=Roseibium sp. HPY-6 TaxID=3229852 RepID=UPI00338DA837
MPTAALTAAETPESLTEQTASIVGTLDNLLDDAAQRVRVLVSENGRVSSRLMEQEQRAAHGLAWLATYVESLRQLDAYATRLRSEGKYGTLEDRIVQLGFAEYLAQIFGGIPMNQGEFVRLSDLGITAGEAGAYRTAEIDALIEAGNTPSIRGEITTLIRDQAGKSTFGDPGLDETMEQIRNEMRRFAEDTVVPNAHEWHLKNEYIPLEVIDQMSELGVFGLSIPEEYGGLGLGKEAMCVVSEELSRAYIGVGSLGTRSEIAAELILCGGTEEQKQHWLPKIASGEILPTAVFTEPNTGSDLASLKTRAVKDGDTWKISGNKTWITHPVRADIMTLLARTNPDAPGYKGLSMFIAEKPRGSDEDPFPAAGMSGGEIEVLGYRGMKEYEIAFDGFEVKADNLLGQVEGEGFKQLMQTFEGARIQTAARALGVAQSALELGLRYAEERIQFGKALIHFPRVADKLAVMTAELMIARQLTYFSSWQKDSGKRCDLEAGMAKLLGARVAWAAADNALQIHGGNGFALEYAISRVLCDARILNIFEGAAEIQAQVIARRLLETRGNA